MQAPRFGQLHKMLSTLRHPVAHAEGYDVAHCRFLAGPAVARIRLLPRQAEAIMQVRRARREETRVWGLTDSGAELADPWRLADHVLKATLDVWLELVVALGECRGVRIELERGKVGALNWSGEAGRALLAGFGDSPWYRLLVGLQ